MIDQISWAYYLGLDPPLEQMAIRAIAVIREAAVSAGGVPPSRYYYVGLTRYLWERWYGSERIPPNSAHASTFLSLGGPD